MEVVDEIRSLSEKGHNQLVSGNYSAAKSYFINAATLALEHGDLQPGLEEQHEYHTVAKSLLSMAKKAHNMTFKQIEDHFVLNKPPNPQDLFKNTSKQIKFRDPHEKELSKENDIAISIPLAREVRSKQLIKWEPERLMNGITLVTGGSGSGKSECLRSLAIELSHHEIPIIILDLHGDLDVGLPTISLDYRGNHSVNPMELTSYSKLDGGPAPHINRLMNQFNYAIRDRFSSTQKSWLRNLLKFAYEQHGIIQEDPSGWRNDPPTFEYLLDLIQYPEDRIIASQKKQYIRLLETITNSTMMAVENRLTPILQHPAFSGNNSIAIDKLTGEPHRVLLKPLNTIENQFLASDTIIRQVFAYLKSIGHIDPDNEGKFRLFIMIDEVKILTGFRGKLNDPYHILNRLATEARKFGLGLILASQIIGHFGRDIKSNAATKLILRTMDLDETKRASKEFSIDKNLLSSLSRPGEGFISTSAQPEARHMQLFAANKHPF